jgi:hypothetical protein
MTIVENKVKINTKNNIKVKTGQLSCDEGELIYRNRNVERHIFRCKLGCVCSVGSICTVVWSKEPEKNLMTLIISNV